MRRDPQFSSVPEAIHFSGEVFGELVRVDHQNGFVVGVGGRGGPVERSCDHGAVVDHGELVIDILEMCLSDWVLRDDHASQAIS